MVQRRVSDHLNSITIDHWKRITGAAQDMFQDCHQSKRRNAVAQMAKQAFAAFFGLLATCSTLHASTYAEEKLKCPVGGEKFKYMGLASISTWGALPDGMPLGSGKFPTLPPQCPSNGLVMYRDFTPQEVSKLTVFVASPEFKALRSSGETPTISPIKLPLFWAMQSLIGFCFQQVGKLKTLIRLELWRADTMRSL